MSDALIDAIGVLVDDDARMHLAGTVVHRWGSEDRSIPFTADGHTGEWAYSIGRMSVSRDVHGTITERIGHRVDVRGNDGSHVPFELRPLFPLTLPIWDRAGDEWRMVSAAGDGDHVIVTFPHRERAELAAELTVDAVRRVVVSWVTPTDAFFVNVEDHSNAAGRFAAYES